MKCFIAIALLAVVSIVRAEPPVPQNNYLPPNQQVQPPANTYLPPTQTYQTPANNYLPPQRAQQPTNAYQAPAASAGPQAPQNTYGAPAVTSAIFHKQQQQQPASNSYSNSGYGTGSGSGSGSNSYGQHDEENYGPAKYEFKYDVQDYESGNDFGHMESRDGDLAVGRYYVLLPDGRKQIVEYEADQNGYRPTIRYEQVNNGANNGAGNAGGRVGGAGGNYAAGGNAGYDNNAQGQGKFGGYH